MASSSSSQSWKYDVFLSFRGEDTRKTFVDHLYCALETRAIRTYKDDVKLPLGDTISLSLMKAIETSKILVIIFSENYADSSWCLGELTHIMKCRDSERGQLVMPIFYHVDPSDVRKQKGQFGKAFAKHELSENNKNKVESWKKALVDASNIAGLEPKNTANGHEAAGIKNIVDTISRKLLSSNPSDVDEKLVGMETRFLYLKQQLETGSDGVRMVGIWGIGGGGKTTLAFSVYMKLRVHFQGHCFVDNIREESQKHGLKKLQEKVISEVLKTQVSLESVHEGKCKIHSMLRRRNVLIILDDVDDLEQLEALAGSHDWFGGGSRIIITTRNEQVLISHRVDVVCPVILLSHDEAIRLFKKHAYHEDKPVQDYEKLSLQVISYVNGLPLALKILGSFLYGKDKNAWMSALDKLKCIPNSKVTDQLKISYDGLDHEEKELFLDIACFYRGMKEDKAMVMLDACGFHSDIGINVLKQKALVSVSENDMIDMHDLVQEMAHYIVRGEHPNNPENHSRVWRYKDIEDMCSRNATMENDKIEAIVLKVDSCSSNCIMHFSNMKKLRLLNVTTRFDEINYAEGPRFLSFLFERLGYYCNLTKCLPNVHMFGSPKRTKQSKTYGMELRYIEWSGYPASLFSEHFQPMKLVVLKINGSLEKELWKGYKHLPCLKKLELVRATELVRTPDFGGLPCLQKLKLIGCGSLKEIHQSLGNHSSLVYLSLTHCETLTRFPSIVRMDKLEILRISCCRALVEFPKIEAKMDNLVELSLNDVGIEVLPSSIGEYCTNLISLQLSSCDNLKSIEGNLIKCLPNVQRKTFPESFQPMKLVLSIHLTLQKKLWNGYKHLPCLKELELDGARELVRTPDFGGLPCLQKLILDFCESLEEIHESLGNHSSLVYVDVRFCEKLTRFPSIVGMDKLEILRISWCTALVEFPKIEAKMDKLVELSLRGVGIEVLPSSIGEYCTKLISLQLSNCDNLKSIEGNFHALKCLENLQLSNLGCKIGIGILRHLPLSLTKLDLSWCELKDGEIPSEIGELSNLRELDLSFNNFTRLDFNLSRLTRLILLDPTGCENLVELPELPSSLVTTDGLLTSGTSVTTDAPTPISPPRRWG